MSYDSEVLADSPLGYWKLDETSGTSAADSSGNSHAGTIGGSPSLNQTPVMPTGTGSILLNSTSKYVEIANGSWMNVAAFTVEAWVNLTSTTSYHAVVTRDGNFGSRGWDLYIKAGKLTAYNGQGASELSATSTITAGTDHHVVMTYASGTVKMYLDGALDGTLTISLPATATNPIEVGASFASTASRNFTLGGRVDHVAYYDTALSATRVAAHYSAAAAPPAPTGTLAASLPPIGAALSGDYAPPPEAGTFTVALPLTEAALSGTYAAPPTGTFGATLPLLNADLAGSYAPPPNPSGVLAATLPLVGAAFSGDYHPHESGTITVSLPLTTAGLTGTYVPPDISGSFATPLPLIVADFTGASASAIGSLAVALPLLAARFEGNYGGPYPTDTSNALDGRDRRGYATATITHPVAAPPNTLTLTPRVSKSRALPTPVMVDGRPT